jgi:integrase
MPGPNPARWGDNLVHLLPDKSQAAKKSKHHPALPYDEMGGFWATLNKQEGVAARALEFVILTAVRCSEATLSVWDEFDLKEKVWTIPAERMKSKRVHRVPLSEAALAILKALPREDGNPFVFIGSMKGKSVSSASVLNYLQAIREDVTVHGMRSTFRDWAFERTNFPRELAEVALAHVVGDATERAYRRGDVLDKRRTMMAQWAKFCTTKPVAVGDNVVAMRA